ncbi:hypothetical protein CAOG_05629 [Capsaspora owczarzaki ATCC 30864]|uniref:hypothetical protein n=1 Tax=Capsaspora owczarzaki (strain ATCC 30864) TaxID=595528 RepID=UPI0001FE33A6|nr:hypothetical protein CAOG_05629 [Capsaspora owczarzaki ATCC 30864]|eukprot:XP_004346302.1 hypothetical protein CAOG_05629 [Capsaspora owczarzaki ATCC 30864]
MGGSRAFDIAPFPYGGTWWEQQRIQVPNTVAAINTKIGVQYLYSDVKDLLTKYKNNGFTFNLALCDDDTCTKDPKFGSELLTPANRVRSLITNLESAGVSPVEDPTSPVMQQLILAGDELRAQVKFPLNVGNSSLAWARNVIADNFAISLRSSGVAQADLGDFNRVLNGTVPRLTKNLTFKTRAYTATQSATVSQASGETIIITRTDSVSTTGQVTVHINHIRANTHAYRDHTSNRPYYLWGNSIPLPANVPVKINNPYGGVIYVTVPPSTSGTVQNVQIKFENVVQHPVYDAIAGGSVQPFIDAVNSKVYGSAEILMPQLQVNIYFQRGPQSLKDSSYAYKVGSVTNYNVTKFMTYTRQYLYEYHYALAGFTSVEVPYPPIAGIPEKAAAFGLRGMNYTGPQHVLTSVQFMNSDWYSQCGAGCSGNPIDLDWAFAPHGWGEHHELGHNIQYGRFKINDDASGEVSNNIFPLSVNYARARAGDQVALRSDRSEIPDRIQTMKNAIANGQTPTEAGLTPADLQFYETLILSGSDTWARDGSQIAGTNYWTQDGFQIIPMLYLMSRNIDAEKNWTAARDNYGLSLFDSTSIPANDFMVMAFSWLNRRDYRSFFWAWGHSWSEKANQQIELYNFEHQPTIFRWPNVTYLNIAKDTVAFPNDPYRPDANTSGGSSANAALIGGIVGGVVALLLLVILAVVIVRRRRSSPKPASSKKSSAVGGQSVEYLKDAETVAMTAPATSPRRNAPVPPTGAGGAAAAGKTFRALYDYKPQSVDELALSVGDVVIVSHTDTDGWSHCKHKGTSRSGVAPASYLQEM